LAQLVKTIESGGQIATIQPDSELGLKVEVALGLKGETKKVDNAKSVSVVKPNQTQPTETIQPATMIN
jgi:hypothetical protein